MNWDQAIAEWESWARASGHSELTIRQRRWCLGVFGDRCGVGPWEVTLGQMVSFLGQPGWKPETRRGYRGALRSFYTWALDYEYVAVDPTRKLPKVRVPETEPHPLPDAVFHAALDCASHRDRLILKLAAYAGMRRAEIAGLRWENVAADHVRIHGKGGKIRHVPLHPDLADDLEAERARRAAGRFGSGYRYTGNPSSPFVFPGRSDGAMSPNAISERAPLLLDGWTIHSARHRFATRAYGADRDLLAVQRLLGHSKPETTRRYAELPAGALERAVLAAGGAS